MVTERAGRSTSLPSRATLPVYLDCRDHWRHLLQVAGKALANLPKTGLVQILWYGSGLRNLAIRIS